MDNSSALEKNNLYNISVIIPVYNMEKYLKKTLDNYILQNNNKIEFIIIDDGSTDLSGSICDTYMNSHKNVRVYHTKNHGVASSRNYGIALSEGEYLAFLDADDFIDKNMLSSMYCFAKEYSLDFVHCGISMERETSDGKYIVQSLLAYDSKNNVYSYHDIVSNMLSLWEKAVPYNVVNKLYKRSIIKDNDINFPDLKMGEDLEFNLRYMKHIKCMGTIPECLYHYVRDRENSATSNYVVNWFPIRVAEHQNILLFFKEFEIKSSEAQEYICRRFVNRVLGCIENEFRDENKSTTKKKIDNIRKMIVNNEVQYAVKHGSKYSLKVKIMLIPIILKCTLMTSIMGYLLALIHKLFPSLFSYLKYKR